MEPVRNLIPGAVERLAGDQPRTAFIVLARVQRDV